MASSFTEFDIEEVCLKWLDDLEWNVVNGAEIVPNTFSAERINYGDIVLIERLQTSLAQLNQSLPADALDECVCKVNTTPKEPMSKPETEYSIECLWMACHR